jgi:hypothetical protein
MQVINVALLEIYIKLRKYFKKHNLYKWVYLLSPIVLYTLLSFLFFGPPNLSSFHKDLFTPGGDPELIVWSLNWWPFAIAHNLNPFITHYIWYPSGFNLTWATSVPSLALIMLPFTHLFGALTTFNLIALFSPIFSSLSCFYLVRYITKNHLASLVSGYLFGFSTYQIAEMLGHPSLYVTFLVPLIVLLFLLRLDDKINKKVFIFVTGVMLAVQFGISNEIFATFIFFGYIALLLFYIFAHNKYKIQLKKTFFESIMAIIFSLVLLIPYLYYMAKGYNTTPHILNSPYVFSTDILNFILPTPISEIGRYHLQRIALRFGGNYSEDGAYLGLPVVIICFYYLFKNKYKGYAKSLIILLFVLLVSTLGPYLHILGHSHLHFAGHHPRVLLPWIVATHTPLIKSALPDRFTLYITLITSTIVGLWLSIKTTTKMTYIKYIFAFLAIAAILPNTSQYNWRSVSTPKIFQPSLVGKYIKKNSNVIILPYGLLGPSMYYQYSSGMWFTQSEGYIGYTPQVFATNHLVEAFISGNPEPTFKSDLASFCIRNNVSEIIIVTSITNTNLTNSLNSLGWKEQIVGNTVIIEVPKTISTIQGP